MLLTHGQLLARIAVGAAFGALVGLERNRGIRPAGFRTHVIVAMASATFMVLSGHFAFYQGYVPERLVAVDPSRIAASVVTGIGFLGGGAILRTGASVHGLTTAAGLWLVSAAGMCAGAGMYPEGLFVTGLGVLSLALLRRLEHKDVIRRRVSLVLDDGARERLEVLMARLAEMGAAISDLDYERCMDHGTCTVSFDVRLEGPVPIAGLIGVLEAQPGVGELRISSPS